MRGLRTGDLTRVAVVVLAMAALQFVIAVQTHALVMPLHPIVVVELLGLPLLWVLGRRGRLRAGFRRAMATYLSVLVGVSVLNAIALLVAVVSGSSDAPIALLAAGFAIVGINWLSFGVIYWWLDAADPAIRAAGGNEAPDFLFPQQQLTESGAAWQPRLLDYLYVSFTNLLAFSPTDTMPLRPRTKVLFMLQSAISTFTAVVIVGHAINSLPG